MSNALHLTAIGLLAPHLTADNHDRVLGAARHKSKREVEVIVAALRPQPAVASSVRRLPIPQRATDAGRSCEPAVTLHRRGALRSNRNKSRDCAARS